MKKSVIWIWIIIAIVALGISFFGLSRKKAQQKELQGKLQETFDEYLPGIVCWGDSLTAGTGGEGVSYPKVLKQLMQERLFANIPVAMPLPEVVNMGVGGEDTHTILGRNGAIPFVVKENMTIPSDTTPVSIVMESASGKAVAPFRQGNAGAESVEINGVTGTIDVIQDSYTSAEFSYEFIRKEPGEVVYVSEGTPIITSGSVMWTDYIPVIFMGENGGFNDVKELIEQQRAIIEHQTSHKERFLIIGLHTGTKKQRAELEEAMLQEYGEKYINLREELCTKGLEAAGLQGTQEDVEMLQKGMVPASLMISDKCHFNAYGYQVIGELIYARMDELGYFDEVKTTIAEITH